YYSPILPVPLLTLELVSAMYPLLDTEVSRPRAISVGVLRLRSFLMNLIRGTSCNTIKIYLLEVSFYAIAKKLHCFWADQRVRQLSELDTTTPDGVTDYNCQ
ncbi:MAG: hypothetical protein ACYT04_78780, partial [Nostoc sp.]